MFSSLLDCVTSWFEDLGHLTGRVGVGLTRGYQRLWEVPQWRPAISTFYRGYRKLWAVPQGDPLFSLPGLLGTPCITAQSFWYPLVATRYFYFPDFLVPPVLRRLITRTSSTRHFLA
jgi:hypothetical protein